MNTDVMGKPLTRVDGRAKVTGAARYAADFNQHAQLYAVIVSATAGRGRVTALDEAPVRAIRGCRGHQSPQRAASGLSAP